MIIMPSRTAMADAIPAIAWPEPNARERMYMVSTQIFGEPPIPDCVSMAGWP